MNPVHPALVQAWKRNGRAALKQRSQQGCRRGRASRTGKAGGKAQGEGEKRAKRARKATRDGMARVARAISQRMWLIARRRLPQGWSKADEGPAEQFVVLGTTGNV